jgi:hypothetical protein
MELSVNAYVGVLETSVPGGDDILAAEVSDESSVGKMDGL